MKIEASRRAAKWQPLLSPCRGSDLVTIVSRSLPRGGTAVLAVSGGVDSMCLLDAAVCSTGRAPRSQPQPPPDICTGGVPAGGWFASGLQAWVSDRIWKSSMPASI